MLQSRSSCWHVLSHMHGADNATLRLANSVFEVPFRRPCAYGRDAVRMEKGKVFVCGKNDLEANVCLCFVWSQA